MSKDRNYADDEVRDIMERALKEPAASGLSHDDLLSIGAGVGLTPAAVENAAREAAEIRLTATATRRIRARRRRWVLAHAAVFAVVNGLLFAVNFLTTPGEWWVLFPIFFWGLALLAHAGYGLSALVSERGMVREKRRLLEAAGVGVARAVERRKGLRVAGPVDQIEASDEAEAEPANEPRSTRNQ